MSKKLILIVDDHEFSVAMLKRVLSKGYRFLVATNGIEAISVLAQHAEEIDLVLLDLKMPEMSGDEVAEHLVLLGVPFVVISTTEDRELIEKASEGAFAFVRKDANVEAIRSAVSAAIAKNCRDASRLAVFYRLINRESIAVGLIASRRNLSLLTAKKKIANLASRHRSTRLHIIEKIIEGHELLAD